MTITASGNGTPQVTVTGPGAFKKTLTSSATLTGLVPGSYAITATDVTTTDAIVASVYHPTVTGTPATVTVGGDAAASVSYAARPGSGGLWVVGGIASTSSTANGAVEYSVAQLHASSSATPAVQLQFPVTAGPNIDPNDIAIDGQGNLWVANDNSNTLVEYPASSLGASASPTPAVTLQLPASSITLALAFDANGDLGGERGDEHDRRIHPRSTHHEWKSDSGGDDHGNRRPIGHGGIPDGDAIRRARQPVGVERHQFYANGVRGESIGVERHAGALHRCENQQWHLSVQHGIRRVREPLAAHHRL
jgi:hypothetical protein